MGIELGLSIWFAKRYMDHKSTAWKISETARTTAKSTGFIRSFGSRYRQVRCYIWQLMVKQSITKLHWIRVSFQYGIQWTWLHFACSVRKCTVFFWQRNKYGWRIDSHCVYVSVRYFSGLFVCYLLHSDLNFFFIDFSMTKCECEYWFNSRLPDTKVLSFEHNDLHEYDSAHRMGKSNVYCSSAFRDCSISLIELALGRYTKPYNFM